MIRQPELQRSLADTSGVRRYQRFGGIEMVGHLGAAPSVCRSGGGADGAPRFVGGRYCVTRSPIRTARIAVFLVPDEMVEPRGVAPRSTQCHCVVLLLDDGPEMDAHPGLAPGKFGFADRWFADFALCAMESREVDGCCPRSAIFTGSNAGCYITASI